MPIIKIRFVNRREKKYFCELTQDMQNMIDNYVKPEVPQGIDFRMPTSRPGAVGCPQLVSVSIQKNIFPSLNKDIYAQIVLNTYDFDNKEGQRVIGANFALINQMGENYTPKAKISLRPQAPVKHQDAQSDQ